MRLLCFGLVDEHLNRGTATRLDMMSRSIGHPGPGMELGS